MFVLLVPSVLFASNAISLYEKYHCEDGYFLPKDWAKTEQGRPYDDMTKVYGVKLSGPEGRDGAETMISLLLL